MTSNTSKSINREIEILRAESEYSHAVSELSRYESSSQKVVSFISLLVTCAFVIGVEKRVESIFPVIPLLAFSVLQYLVSNNYAYRVREAYVHRLEEVLRSDGSRFPALYGRHIKKYYLNLKWSEMFFLPFSGAVAYILGGVLLIAIFSAIKGYNYIVSILGYSYGVLYYIICIVLIVYTLLSAIWSIQKLSGIYTEDRIELNNPE